MSYLGLIISFLCLCMCISVKASDKAFLRLSGYVPTRAHVDIEGVSKDGEFVDLNLKKNTRRMNFRMVAQPYGVKNSKKMKKLVLAHRGEKKRLNLNPYKGKNGRILVTILSP